MLLAGATIFTSCKKDEETGPAPTISFSNYPTGAYEIDFATLGVTTFDLSFVVSVTAEEEISTFTAKKKIGSSTTNLTAPADFEGKTSYTYNYLGTFLETDTYPVFLIFTVTDKADQTTEHTFTVTKIITGTPIGAINSYTGVTLGAQNATTGAFWASASNSVYMLSSAAANCINVDICYFYGATNQATLGAPTNTNVQTVFSSVASWTTKNNTIFIKNPGGFTFAGIDATTDISGLTFGTETQANLLAVGDLVAFKTVNNKIGFASVTAINPVNTGDITFSVKVQQ